MKPIGIKNNKTPFQRNKGLVTCRDTVWELFQLAKKLHMKRNLLRIPIFAIIITSSLLLSCGGSPNTNYDSHFDEEGCLIRDSLAEIFSPTHPKKIKFYVEVSGSMNGFFRANAPTKFKEDVWRVLSYYSPVSDDVTILTNDGAAGATIPITTFQTKMNTGAFVSSASTKVPIMLKSIISSLNPDEGEVAVLISDMKYSPVGAAAPKVLLTQYSTDISRIFGEYGKAISLVGAKSQYLDKAGNAVCQESPYYFLIIGNQEHVADIRNGISTLVENNGNLIGNIESGFNYGAPSYSFGISENGFQKDDEPTFLGYDPSYSDTCLVKLRVNLANYRWVITREDIFPQAFQCKATYGSEVIVGDIKYFVQNITNKNLERTAYAEVDLKLCNMATDSEVIEWTLQLPDLDITEFTPYLGAADEDDVTKSYSLEDFIKGMFYGGVVNRSLKPNYILISKKS